MDLRQRGVAHVNIFWALVPMVMFFGALGYGYVKHTDFDKAKINRDNALAEKAKAVDENGELKRLLSKLTEQLGNVGLFKPLNPEVPDITKYTTPEKLKNELTAFKQNVGIPDSMALLPDILDEARSQVASRDQQIQTLTSSVRDAQDAKRKADEAVNTIRQSNQDEVSRLEQEKRQVQRTIERTSQDFINQLTDVRGKRDKTLQDLESVKTEAAAKEAALQREISLLDARLVNTQAKIKLINSPQEPDGTILSSSEKTGLAYIDLGSRDMIKVGMTFRILEPTRRGYRLKAHGRVREVKKDRSQITVTRLVNRLNPVVRGDFVANDLYTKLLKRDIFLLGRFNEPYSKTEITKILEEMGNRVHDKLTPSVDLVIAGRKLLGEEAVELTEMPEYKQAINQSMEIVALRKIRDFLKL